MSKLLTGTFLVLLGCVFILANFGYVSWDIVGELGRLWPLLLVAWGISLMARGTKAPYLAFLGPLILVLALVYVIWGNYHGAGRNVESYNVSQELTDIEEAEVLIRFAGGKLTVTPGDTLNLIEADLDYNADGSRPRLVYAEEEGLGRVTLRHRGDSHVGPGMGNDWGVRLTNEIPLELRVVSEAASCNLDLEGVQVGALEITAGASTVSARLGGHGADMQVKVDAGVSTVKLEIPSEYGIRMLLSCGLCAKDLPKGMARKPGGGSAYYSRDYDEAPHKVDLEIDAGLSRVVIAQY